MIVNDRTVTLALIIAISVVLVTQKDKLTMAIRTFDQSPLGVAVIRGDEVRVREILRSGEADIDRRGNNLTVLHLAAMYSNVRIVELLLSHGAELDAKGGKDNSTPLGYASACGNNAILVALLAAGAQVDVRDDFGRTPLMYASANGHVETVKLLLEAGANPFATCRDSSDRKTARQRALRRGHSSVATVLDEAMAAETLGSDRKRRLKSAESSE